MEKFSFTDEERQQAYKLIKFIKSSIKDSLQNDDERKIYHYFNKAIKDGTVQRDSFGLNPILNGLCTAQIAIEEIGLGRDGVVAIMLYSIMEEQPDEQNVSADFGESVNRIIHGLLRIRELYKKSPVIESENFRNLLLSFAEDMRVILIMIADRVNLMRQIRDTDNEEARHRISEEASYLYAPLAHKLIERFIGPIQQHLQEAGLKFHMKGRTKSIHSIWQKMKKQKCGFEGIYDLFAIRIIIDSPQLEKEKMLCWQAYSIVTDMYQPNPKRLRDWLSVPKSNGYECLHITVLGPENKWVEVQIRTERMDEIAERGLAAHWRYKGVKGENNVDEWLNSFTPKGDLLKFPKGATILDFAYHIHSGIGNTCVGGRINGKAVSIREVLHSGDTIEILTQSNQKPKRDWINLVYTSRAKSKIRLAIKDAEHKDGILAKEALERRFKNKKVDVEESIMSHTIKKLGFKVVSDFYRAIADEKLDINTVVDKYINIRDHELNPNATVPTRSAEEFNYYNPSENIVKGNDDVLVIDRNLKGLEFSLAKCCRPIYGDPVFGFVTVNGGIKVHRQDCPNAAELRKRFGYRIVKARWSGKGTSQYSITLRIIGNDDIGIVNNITNIISKEEKIMMRSININSHDGLFSGNLDVILEDTSKLEALLKKLRTIRGVKQVIRI